MQKKGSLTIVLLIITLIVGGGFLPLLVFTPADKRTNDQKLHTALVVCYHQRGIYLCIAELNL
jgi:hypothetical protein